MKKKYLSICNSCLLLLAPFVLSSGIVLEHLHGEHFCGIENTLWVYMHIAISCLMTCLVVWHVWLNWQKVNKWYIRLMTHRSQGLKIIFFLYLMTTISGIITMPLWLHCGHIGIGGVHGKIGFMSALCILLHIIKHRKWFYCNKPNAK